MESRRDAAEVLYDSRIRARMSKSGRAWTSVKNGFGGVCLAVSEGSVKTYAPGLPRRVARALGLDRSLAASDVTFANARIGWLGTSLFARDCVVLSWRERTHDIQLAVAPEDADLDRLRSALVASGASAAPPRS